MSIDKKRDEASEEFQNASFRKDEPSASLDKLKQAALKRINVEVSWYRDASNKRWWPSLALRGVAIVLAAYSAFILEVASFGPHLNSFEEIVKPIRQELKEQALVIEGLKAQTPKIDSGEGGSAVKLVEQTCGADMGEQACDTGWTDTLLDAVWPDPVSVPVYSVVSISIALLLLFIDKHYALTKGMTRFRRTEYSLRVKRAAFASEFAEHRQKFQKIDENAFQTFKVISEQNFVSILEYIKAETIAWADTVDANLETLVEDLTKQKAAAEASAVKIADKIEKASFQARLYPLKFKVLGKPDRTQEEYKVVILGDILLDEKGKPKIKDDETGKPETKDDKTYERVKYELYHVLKDEWRTIMVPPGHYEVSALDAQADRPEKVITSTAVEVKADPDNALETEL